MRITKLIKKTKKPWIERIYHPYWDWEEIEFNMWGSVEDRHDMLHRAIEFTGDHEEYGKWMMKVATSWVKSCQHNLSNRTQNRKAWIGHAACAMSFGCPEDIVREAWGYLSEYQQILANEQAQIAIEYWEDEICQKQD